MSELTYLSIPIRVTIVEKNLAEAAEDTGFANEEGHCFVLGGLGLKEPAAHVETRAWVGIHGDSGGGYTGLCAQSPALLNNRGRCSAAITAGAQSYDVCKGIIMSFRFLRSPKQLQ